MLGRTAGGVFWMFRYLERSENAARLVDAGFRIALTRAGGADDEWDSLLTTGGARDAYRAKYDTVQAARAIDFLLRDKANPSSVLRAIGQARDNARQVRTAITREVWEATNECWMTLAEALARPVRERDLPAVLGAIRRHSALVRGALHGTMLRNDIFNFARVGTFLERGDNTARILDFKYYVLLPSASFVGSSIDNAQWETILRSVSALRAYRWLHKGSLSARGIAEFLILDSRMPRSLAFCHRKIHDNLAFLERDYGRRLECHAQVESARALISGRTIDSIFESGLHEYLVDFLAANDALGRRIERDYRFYR